MAALLFAIASAALAKQPNQQATLQIKPVSCNDLPKEGWFINEPDSYFIFKSKQFVTHTSRKIQDDDDPVWNRESDIMTKRVTFSSSSFQVKIIVSEQDGAFNGDDKLSSSILTITQDNTDGWRSYQFGKYDCLVEYSVELLKGHTRCSHTQIAAFTSTLLESSAKQMSHVSTGSYINSDRIQCKQKILFNQIREIHGIQKVAITSDNEANVVYFHFQGTQNNLDDWMINLQFKKKNCYGYQVHSGFCKEFHNIKGKIAKDVNYFAERGYRFVLSGHSQGGALANLAVVYIYEYAPIEALITWGSPRVGTARFARAVAKKVANRLKD
eukprot:Awhi_evm1s13996